MRTVYLIALILMCTAAVWSQTVLGQLGYDPIKEDERTVNVNENPVLVINSPITDLRVDSKNRNIIKRIEQPGGRWAVVLPAGTHKLVFDAKGYEELELDNYVFAKNRTYEIRIFEVRAPRNAFERVGKGTITIRTIPQGASVALDGIPGEWKSPAIIKNILAAPYTISVYKENYDTTVFSATVMQDSILDLPVVKLIPRFGFLKVITENGALMQVSGLRSVQPADSILELSIGKHTLSLNKSRYSPYTSDITITAGDTTVLQQSLTASFAYFDFSFLSRESEISLDGNSVRNEVIETTPGEHRITVTNFDFGEVTKIIKVDPGASRVITEKDMHDPGDLLVDCDMPAQLFIDGHEEALSTVKLDVPAGLHTVKVVNIDLGEEVRTVRVMPNKENDVFISFLPSRSAATFLTFFPGVKQMYIGSTTRGLLYLTCFLASAAGSYYYYDQYHQKINTYNGYVAEYTATTNRTRAMQLDGLITSTYSQMMTIQKQQQTAYYVTGGVFLWNILDAMIFGPRYGYRKRQETAFNVRYDPKYDNLTMDFHVTF